MKKIIFPLSLLFYCAVNAQNTFPSSGNAGIGTTTPSTQLEVKGITKTDTLLFPDGTFQTTATRDSVQLLKVGKNSLVVTEKGAMRDDGALRIQTADTVTQVTCIIIPPTSGQQGGGSMICDSSTVIFSPNDNNTIINAGNIGKVGIGIFSPTEKLTVEGTIQSTSGGFKFPDNTIQTTASTPLSNNPTFNTVTVTNKIITPRITSPDSIIRFGDSTLVIDAFYPRLYNDQTTSTQKGIGIGYNTNGIGIHAVAVGGFATAAGIGSIAVGDYVLAAGTNSILFGTGTGTSPFPYLLNSQQNSFMIGFNSDIPTLTVRQASGAGTTGNVGIGTSNPVEKLDVAGNALFSGNVGIGTTTPQSTLDVRGYIINGGSDFKLGMFDGRPQKTKTANRALVHDGWQAGQDNLVINYDGDFEDGVFVGGPKLVVDGNVGIGTTCPSERLAVNGKIKARQEVIVEATGGWCDYKFESTYKRMTWQDKMNYFKEFKHLPDVEPESIITSDGLKLAHTMKGLTGNVEDNSLDIIDIYQRLEKVEKENAILKQLFLKLGLEVTGEYLKTFNNK
ncbi:MAG: hypothetical protein HY841_09315 [Bacteroidetes bacterium]|nr:hypothetical protein [Bacteroidota bacterium]